MLTVLKEAAKGSRLQAILIGWFAPVTLGAYAFIIVLLPDLRDTGLALQVRTAVRILGVNRFLFVLVASLALAVFMYMNRTFLYKLLEGELWPRHLRQWRIARAHVPHHRFLMAKQEHARALRVAEQTRLSVREVEDNPLSTAELTAARAELETARQRLARAARKLATADTDRLRRGRPQRHPKVFARLPRRRRPFGTPSENRHPEDPNWIPTYPVREDQVMATRVGNELKAMETYGSNSYGLDSQTLWYELYSDAPDALRASIDDAELQADTFVCAMYVASSLSIAALCAGIWKTVTNDTQANLWLTAMISAVAVSVLHRGLLASIEEWSAGVRALVNNGRLQLAEKYGLTIPQSSDTEREMWDALTGFVYYGGDTYYADKLDRFKKKHSRSHDTGFVGRLRRSDDQ